jgi:hypothetical protein
MTKIEGSGSGFISQKHGSEDPDPDPPQNVMDPEHWPPVSTTLEQLVAKFATSFVDTGGAP